LSERKVFLKRTNRGRGTLGRCRGSGGERDSGIRDNDRRGGREEKSSIVGKGGVIVGGKFGQAEKNRLTHQNGAQQHLMGDLPENREGQDEREVENNRKHLWPLFYQWIFVEA